MAATALNIKDYADVITVQQMGQNMLTFSGFKYIYIYIARERNAFL